MLNDLQDLALFLVLDLYYTDPAQQPPLTTEDEEPDYLDHRSHLSVRAVKCSGPRGQAIPTIIPDDLGDDLSHLCEL